MLPARRYPPALLLLVGLCTAGSVPGAEATQHEQQHEPTQPELHCADGIEGTWVGLEKRPNGMLHYTLTIQRINPASPALIGTIDSHFWPGTATRPPTDCGPDDFVFIMHQPAAGAFLPPRIEFSAGRVERVENICGESTTYWPDGFTGQLTADGTAFRTISDDGHTDAQSVTLRRTDCPEG